MRGRAALATVLVLSGACEPVPRGPDTAGRDTAPAVGGATSPEVRRYAGIGRAPTAAEIRAWDIDVNPRGHGLPAGRGTYARGAAVYRASCASCHGADGEGIAASPALVGREPADFGFARLGPSARRTIGNYWPYATTLYDYVNRAMPFDAPGSLPPDDVYSVVAFLLARNGIIDSTAVVDARSLPRIAMPARDRFVPDDRVGGPTFR